MLEDLDNHDFGDLIDPTSEDAVVCPYCGVRDECTWEYKPGLHKCGDCGKEYRLEVCYRVTYTTFKAEE